MVFMVMNTVLGDYDTLASISLDNTQVSMQLPYHGHKCDFLPSDSPLLSHHRSVLERPTASKPYKISIRVRIDQEHTTEAPSVVLDSYLQPCAVCSGAQPNIRIDQLWRSS